VSLIVCYTEETPFHDSKEEIGRMTEDKSITHTY